MQRGSLSLALHCSSVQRIGKLSKEGFTKTGTAASSVCSYSYVEAEDGTPPLAMADVGTGYADITPTRIAKIAFLNIFSNL
jgi:hypothetical protein